MGFFIISKYGILGNDSIWDIDIYKTKIVRKVIGQNQNQLITFENELIPISDILDINFVK